MRSKLPLVATIAVLFLISACTTSRSEEPSGAISTRLIPVVEPAAEDEQDYSVESVAEVENQSAGQKPNPATQTEMAEPAEEMPAGISDEFIDESDDKSGQQDANQDTQEEMPDESEKMATESSMAEPMGEERPTWQQITLSNARTGEMFTLADFAGKTVFVEPMATWCGNCRRQLTNVRDAKLRLSDDEVVFIALSVETNIDDGALADYADGQVFDWLFAVLSPDMLRQLVDEFGRVIANPPATPHFIIRADGTSTELVTGIEPADQIVSQIVAAQG